MGAYYGPLILGSFGDIFYLYFRCTPHPGIVTISDKDDFFRVLLYSY